jgi:hypothetical protein
MNHLILVVATIPVFLLLVPNVYASTDDNPTKFSDEQFKALSDCSKDGYNDGQNNPFDQQKNEEL